MSMMPWRAKIYIAFIELLAAGVLLFAVPHFQVEGGQIIGMLAFAFLSVFSEYLAVTLPYIGNISVTYAIDIALILTFGVPVAVIVSAVGYLGACFLNRKQEPIVPVKLLFNQSQFIVTIFVSGMVFHAVADALPAGTGYYVIATAIGALTYFVVNFSIVTFLFSFLQHKKVWGIWIMNMRWAVPNFLALAPIGYILSYVYLDIGPLGLFIFFIPLLLARHTFKLYMDMRGMYLKSIQSLALTIDAKDHYTAGHSERVTQFVVAICEEMEMEEEATENLKDISLLHDIGKISVSESILNKPDKLTDEEYAVMKKHSQAGYDIVKQMSFLKEPETILYHHERYDGKGYPEGLKGEEIPFGARIIAVADAYDAMTTTRPYRKALPHHVAMEELERFRGIQFDPQVVDAFRQALPKIIPPTAGAAGESGPAAAAENLAPLPEQSEKITNFDGKVDRARAI